MYSTKIEINNKVIPIRFGAYVLKCIADDGVKLQELGERMQDNPADMFPKIIYYGALNASEGRRGDNVNINDIYDWLDVIDGGLFGEEASKIIELFTKHMTDSLPKNVQAVQEKKAPQTKAPQTKAPQTKTKA